ncbi:hypothetical protein DAI22_08g091801 [Oryza sativa Japonica Group]|nr:hypothetical protein DAI22_08g091801 [Oryza sativa Japonica Group]
MPRFFPSAWLLSRLVLRAVRFCAVAFMVFCNVVLLIYGPVHDSNLSPPVKSASIPRALPPAPSPPCRHQFVDPSRAATGFHPTASQVR